MGRLKQQAVIWMSGALLMFMCGTAMASTRTEIDSISLDVESNIEAAENDLPAKLLSLVHLYNEL